MENPGYIPEDDDARVSLRTTDMSDHVTPSSELPPGEEIIEPVIVQTTSSGTSTIFDPSNSLSHRRHSPDGGRDKRRNSSSPHTSVYRDNEDTKPPGRRASSDISRPRSAQHRKKSTPALAVNDQPIEEDDGFPWNPPKRSSQASVEMDATSVTMHDWRSETRSSVGESKRKKKRFAWCHRVMKILRDNRVQTEAAKQELISLDKMQDTQFGRCKKIMNVLFLSAGMILLMAVIVLIIFTDTQFDESMKALTVFLAGRRQGLW